MSDLGELADSIKEMTEESLAITHNIAMDKAGNELIASTLEGLFGKDSSLTLAIETIKESILDDQDLLPESVKELQNNTTFILEETTSLIASVGDLAAQLQQYITAYTDWLGKQIDSSEIKQNTAAINQLTTSIDNLSNKLDGSNTEEYSKDPFGLYD